MYLCSIARQKNLSSRRKSVFWYLEAEVFRQKKRLFDHLFSWGEDVLLHIGKQIWWLISKVFCIYIYVMYINECIYIYHIYEWMYLYHIYLFISNIYTYIYHIKGIHLWIYVWHVLYIIYIWVYYTYIYK